MLEPLYCFVLTRLLHISRHQNIALTTSPNAEVCEVKKMLLKKLALVEASQQRQQFSAAHSSAVTALFSLLWLASTIWQARSRWNDLVFLYNGKVMHDDGTLADYMLGSSSVRSVATVHVSLRLKGGCFMVSASVFCLLCTAVIGSTCTCGASLVAVPFLLPLLFVLPFFCL
jgi:hypothetical protein